MVDFSTDLERPRRGEFISGEFSKKPQKRPKNSPKIAQTRPKHGPKTAQKRPKNGPKTAQKQLLGPSRRPIKWVKAYKVGGAHSIGRGWSWRVNTPKRSRKIPKEPRKSPKRPKTAQKRTKNGPKQSKTAVVTLQKAYKVGESL